MTTRKLYYEDSHIAGFRAAVVGCIETGKGYEIELDATAFYPEGGGQAADTGTLGNVRVLDTRERDGQIIHLCDGPLTIGSEVDGVIDYDARFSRMQQHSGEHIVSGILHRRFGCSNVGFHMGENRTTIDFDAVIPQEALAEVEAAANAAVWANLPVRIWTPSPEELAELSYRTKRALPWPVRIVEFPGFDRCACCGTHVAMTGEIGLVKLFSAIAFKGGTRIEMACGKNALAQLDLYYRQCLEVSHICSVPAVSAGEGARQLADQLAAAKYTIVSMRRQRFAETAQRCAGMGCVLHTEEGLDSTGIRELAEAIAHKCGGIAAVFSGTGEDAWNFCLAAPGQDLKALGKELNAALCGRGGGRGEFWQGSAKCSADAVRAFFAVRKFTETFVDSR